MGNTELRAAVENWTAAELEKTAARDVSWWVVASLSDPGWAAPGVTIFVIWGGMTGSAYVPWPPDEEYTRKAARKALAEMGLLKPPVPQ